MAGRPCGQPLDIGCGRAARLDRIGLSDRQSQRIPSITELRPLPIPSRAKWSSACGGSDSLSDAEYFPRVASLAADLDNALGPHDPAAIGTRDATPVPMSIEAELRTFALELDGMRPPGDAKEAHHDLTVASKNLADAASAATGDARYAATPGAVIGNAVFVRDWEAACHLLQDRATADGLDVDLHCATALHQSRQGS